MNDEEHAAGDGYTGILFESNNDLPLIQSINGLLLFESMNNLTLFDSTNTSPLLIY